MAFDLEKQFGCRVFSDYIMRQKLPKSTYQSLQKTIREGLPLASDVAEVVAGAMKDWAVSIGATHFTHWFQPMMNITAGKHDAFLIPTSDGRVINEFSGKMLTQGEPDASSFPNGGLRSTFEARGYTSWDPNSPAFVKDSTLYIPTAFCSYNGEALDKKTPLLRSMEAVSAQAMRILHLFGNSTSRRVIPTVGAEQEYFLVDRDLYEQRLDLKICGRTLFGAKPVKGQELDDHYCGRIKIRVSDYMRQLDEELWALGVTAKTEHNEAAPAQFELAPLFSSANVACDHNQLIMSTMRIIAKKNSLACLLHEKPFEGINGSGKHNNWSLSTDDGLNLLDPGKTPYENVQFLLFLCAIITAVDRHPDLLRMSAASTGNDHRLGGYEAPPTIISIFLGDQLTSILEESGREDGKNHPEDAFSVLSTGVKTLPQLPKDSSDRNRTSPFAFTGNKFEFRMVGSTCSIADANFVLNTIVAEALDEFATRLEGAENFDAELRDIFHDTMRDHGRVIFNGNNYSEEWVEEAKRRGLPMLDSSLEAYASYLKEENIALFEKYHVFSKEECYSRFEVLVENYVKVVLIEASVMLDMANKQILPVCIQYAGELAHSINQVKQAGFFLASVEETLGKMTELIDHIADSVRNLHDIHAKLTAMPVSYHTALECKSSLEDAMRVLRGYCDTAEGIVPKAEWPMPDYTELLHKM